MSNEQILKQRNQLIEELSRIANFMDADGLDGHSKGGNSWKDLALEMSEIAAAAIKDYSPDLWSDGVKFITGRLVK